MNQRDVKNLQIKITKPQNRAKTAQNLMTKKTAFLHYYPTAKFRIVFLIQRTEIGKSDNLNKLCIT